MIRKIWNASWEPALFIVGIIIVATMWMWFPALIGNVSDEQHKAAIHLKTNAAGP